MTSKPRKHEQAIAALLSTPTIADAAKAVGLGEKTLRRWLHEDPAFQAAYHDARRQAVQNAVARLQGLLSKATATLDRAMTCGSSSVEVRAALAVIDQAYRGAELLELADRVAKLERQSIPLGHL
jgi:uncharacterized protein YggE